MATDIGELKAKVTIDNSQATSGLESVQGSLNFVKNAIIATFVVEGLQAIKGFAEGLVNLANEAAQTGRVQQIFNNQFKDSSKALNDLTAATAGTISQMDLMKMSNQAFGKGLKLSATDLGKLFQVSRIEAAKTGSTTETVFNTIENALSRGMPNALKKLDFHFKDNFGKVTTTVTKAGKAIKAVGATTTTTRTVIDKFGVSHQVTTTHVNNHTKALAGHAATTKEVTKNVAKSVGAEELLASVLDQSTGIIKENTDLNHDNQSSIERLNAQLDNVKTGFLELVNKGLTIFFEAIKPLQPFIDEIGHLFGELAKTIMTGGVNDTLKDMGKNLKEAFTENVRNTLKDIVKHMVDFINYLKTPEGKQALKDFADNLKAIGVIGVGVIEVIGLLVRGYIDAAAWALQADMKISSFFNTLRQGFDFLFSILDSGGLSGIGQMLSSVVGGLNLGKTSGFAVGSDYIPRDMMTIVHQGERIIPAHAVDSANMSGNGSGATINNYMTFRDPSEYESYNRNLKVQLKI